MGQMCRKKESEIEETQASQRNVFIKINIIGSERVGKTSLCQRLINNSFPHTYFPTIGADFYQKAITTRQGKVQLEIWDSAGQPRFRCITLAYTHNCQYLILVYDVSNRQSFQEILSFSELTEQDCQKTVAKILVGNKCDLQDEREVSAAQGYELANKLGFQFLQTSCKDAVNVEKLFSMFLSEITQQKKRMLGEQTKNRKEQKICLLEGCCL